MVGVSTLLCIQQSRTISYSAKGCSLCLFDRREEGEDEKGTHYIMSEQHNCKTFIREVIIVAAVSALADVALI